MLIAKVVKKEEIKNEKIEEKKEDIKINENKNNNNNIYDKKDEEREKQNKNFDETFKKMSQFGDVDSNYNKMVNMLKGTDLVENSLKMENDNWENMDFLEKMDEFPDNKEELKLLSNFKMFKEN